MSVSSINPFLSSRAKSRDLLSRLRGDQIPPLRAMPSGRNDIFIFRVLRDFVVKR